jgi:CheY-like chemotaxis protein
MEARKFWNVLIVDDEPDIHQISELSLKRETVFGAKLKLHHAKSAKEARDFFQYDEAAAALAVAFIDVVMETDDAGLQLCKYIREERGEHVTQLILRTGQPGKAPPRQIIDDHNVSGYITKIEATPDRLYMVLKSAIQQYYNLQYLFWSAQIYDTARRYCKTPAELFKRVKAQSRSPASTSTGAPPSTGSAESRVMVPRAS